MLKIYTSGLLLVIFLLTACTGKQQGTVISFDDAAGYQQNASLVNDQSHSESVSVCVGPELIYGLCYKSKIGLLAPGGVSKVKVSAWVRTRSNESDGDLVVGIDSAEKNVNWNAISVKAANPVPGQWTEIEGTFDMKQYNQPENVLVIYPYSTGKDKIWFDDISISFIP